MKKILKDKKIVILFVVVILASLVTSILLIKALFYDKTSQSFYPPLPSGTIYCGGFVNHTPDEIKLCNSGRYQCDPRSSNPDANPDAGVYCHLKQTH